MRWRCEIIEWWSMDEVALECKAPPIESHSEWGSHLIPWRPFMAIYLKKIKNCQLNKFSTKSFGETPTTFLDCGRWGDKDGGWSWMNSSLISSVMYGWGVISPNTPHAQFQLVSHQKYEISDSDEVSKFSLQIQYK